MASAPGGRIPEARLPTIDPDTGRRRGWTGYLLLLPAALWLGLFFVIPFYSLVATSLFDPSGSDSNGYEMTYHFANYWHALQDYWQPLLRSLVYGGIATLLCLVLGYVLAYAIAFKAGRWKNLMLVLVIAPFFTSFLVRTLSWKLILADDGFVVNTLQCAAPPRPRRPAAGHPGRRDRRADATTSCRSWCCRCSPASTRSTTG